jgi:hypothetical protein
MSRQTITSPPLLSVLILILALLGSLSCRREPTDPKIGTPAPQAVHPSGAG